MHLRFSDFKQKQLRVEVGEDLFQQAWNDPYFMSPVTKVVLPSGQP